MATDSKPSLGLGAKRKLIPSPVTSPKHSRKHTCLSSNAAAGDNVRLTKGQSVHVYSEEEAWREGVVVAVDSTHNLVTVNVKDSPRGKVSQFHAHDVLLSWEQAVDELNNLTHVTPVHEATILSCLRKRYERGLYYTNAGNTVVAINPSTDVRHLYTLAQIQAYHTREPGLAPHIYPVAENAYTSLLRELGQVNQSIVISGESGAGKTVSAKHLLRYLTIVTNPAAEKWSEDDKSLQIEQRVVDSNPILEAFGNAATTRNENSSRFGKFIELQFLRMGQIKGGAIHTYLLEKTRVMHPGQAENNFHVFYQLTGVREGEERFPQWVTDMHTEIADTSFMCVPHNQDCSENVDLGETLDAMTRIGLCSDKQQLVFQVILAILYLGNLGFVQVGDDSSDLDHNPMSEQALERSSELLGVSPDHLRQTLLHRCLQAGGRHRHSIFLKPIGIAEARSRRDVLAMLLYSRLFEWLVSFINHQIKADDFDNVIGILDIYGFEIFPTNSLEQLCINYANERLQQHYVAHFLKNLQMEYSEEGLQWVPIDYTDNRPCVNLLDGKLSVFSLLNEEVYLNRKSDDDGLRGKLLQLSAKSHDSLRSPRVSASDCPCFVVQHYAGEVQYAVHDLVSKNKDDIPSDVISLLTSSDVPFVQQLFSSYTEPQSPTGRKKKTVLTKFKSSLDELMLSLAESDVHYIRCLRPNVLNKPHVFQVPYVLQQLRACGTIESVDICRKGYPARMPYAAFQQRYSLVLRSEFRLGAEPRVSGGDWGDGEEGEEDGEEVEIVGDALDILLQHQLLLPASPHSNTPRKKTRPRSGRSEGEHVRRVCATVLQSVCGSQGTDLQCQFGRTKLFLTEQQLEDLECARLAVLHHSATCLQSAWRGLCCRRDYRRLLAAKTILRAWLAFKTRQRYLCLKNAILTIQRAWLTLQTRRTLLVYKQAAVVIQKTWRTFVARRKFVGLKRASVVVQARWTMVVGRRRFVRVRGAAVVVQRAWRMFVMRRSVGGVRESPCVLQTSSTISMPSSPRTTTTPLETAHIPKTLQPSPETPTATDCTDSAPGWDGNLSDDSGVMVHEPLQAGKRMARQSRRERDRGREREGVDGGCQKRQRLKAYTSLCPRLQDLHFGDGVISRHRIPKLGVRFHTRASVLRYGHKIHRRELSIGLPDVLVDVPYGGTDIGSSVDP